MSICPVCKRRVKGGNKRKVWGVWVHKSHKNIKPKEDDWADVAFLAYRKGSEGIIKGGKIK